MYKLTLIFCLICLISISQSIDFHLERLNISNSEDIFKSKMIDISNGHFLTQNSKLYSFSNTAISEISFPEGLKIENFVFENKQQGMIVGKVEKNQLPFFITKVSEPKENTNDYNLYFEKVYSGHHLLQISDTKKWIVGYTHNGGVSWEFRELRTNFDVSSCNVENNVYYITTRGPEDHLDGDIWKIEPQKNMLISLFRIGRSVNGIKFLNRNLLVFGTRKFADKTVIFILNPFLSKKKKKAAIERRMSLKRNLLKGELLYFNAEKDSINEFNIPGETEILDVSITPNHKIWALAKNGFLYSISDNSVTEVSSKLNNIQALAIFNDSLGVLLSHDNKLYTFKGLNYEMEQFDNSEISTKKIFSIQSIPNGNKVLISGEKGFIGIISLK